LSNPEPSPTYADLAGLIDYAVTRSELTETDVSRACDLAKQNGVASVMVRPSDVDLVARWMTGTGVKLGTLVDSPHGYSTTAAKTYAVRDLLRRGVQEIDTVMNTGKLISRQFQYLETELLQMADACHQSAAILKVNLESEFLTEELNIVACRIARRAGADYIGTNKLEDVAVLLSHSRERLKIKCTAPAADLETALAFRDAGCGRIVLADPVAVLGAWRLQCEKGLGVGDSGLGAAE
jgi:deoxyribose-phosphate aldolase